MAADLSMPESIQRVPKWHGVSFPVHIPGTENQIQAPSTVDLDDPEAITCTVGDLIQACKNSVQYLHPHVTCPADGYPVLGMSWTVSGWSVITGLPTNSGLDGSIYLPGSSLLKVLRALPSREVLTVAHLGVFLESK